VPSSDNKSKGIHRSSGEDSKRDATFEILIDCQCGWTAKITVATKKYPDCNKTPIIKRADGK